MSIVHPLTLRRRASQLLLALMLIIGSGLCAAQQTSYQGMWWVEAESGWGFNISHQGDIIAAAWYTYDTNGKPLWLILAALKQPDGSYSGDLYKKSGSPFSQINGMPVQTTSTLVGTAKLRFTGSSALQMNYTFNGVAQQKNMTRYNFSATPPTCAFTSTPMSSASNFTDLWWNPTENGWGVNLIHQGDIVAAAWYTYGSDGLPMWLIASPGKQPDGSYTGRVFRATAGTPILQINGSPAVQQSAMQDVGSIKLSFSNGERGTMSFTVDGVTQSKSIERFAFASPRSVCTAASSGGNPGGGSGQCYPPYNVGDFRESRNTSQLASNPQIVAAAGEYITGTSTYEGHPVYVVENRDEQNRVTQKLFIEQTATEIVQWGADLYDPATGVKNGTLKYNPAFRIPRNLTLNENVNRVFDTVLSVTQQGYTYNATDRHVYDLKWVGNESATAPAGTFNDACKITIKDAVTAQATGATYIVDIVQWSKGNVGPIKTTAITPTAFGTTNSLIELLRANIGGVSFP